MTAVTMENGRIAGEKPARDVVETEVMRHVRILADRDPEFVIAAYSLGHFGLEKSDVIEIVFQVETSLALTGLTDDDLDGARSADALIDVIVEKSFYAPLTAWGQFERGLARFEPFTLFNEIDGRFRRWLRKNGSA
jgi:hypothetical protein